VRHLVVDEGLDLRRPLRIGETARMDGATVWPASGTSSSAARVARRAAPAAPVGRARSRTLVPALPQYWTPLGAGVVEQGTLRVGSDVTDLTHGRVYREKNWGRSFPAPRLVVGCGARVPDPRLVVAFGGGPLSRPRPRAHRRRRLHAHGSCPARHAPDLARRELDRGRSLAGGGRRAAAPRAARGARRRGHLARPAPPGAAGSGTCLAGRQAFAGEVSLLLERRAAAAGGPPWCGVSPFAGLERGAAISR
jgi:hypothetical protein